MKFYLLSSINFDGKFEMQFFTNRKKATNAREALKSALKSNLIIDYDQASGLDLPVSGGSLLEGMELVARAYQNRSLDEINELIFHEHAVDLGEEE